MYVPARLGRSFMRAREAGDQSKNSGQGSGRSTTTTVSIIVAIAVPLAFVLAFIGYRRWKLSKKGGRYAAAGRDDADRNTPATTQLTSATAMMQSAAAGLSGRGNTTTSAAVDRNTSIRSIMTLPPYRPKPSEEEHVLGREGERDGIDVVVEMPTAEDEEALRESEMDALFQIRQARRRQQMEREELRQARREARDRNDTASAQALRAQLRTVTTTNAEELQALREEHERAKATRQRAISSVSYAAVGVARHDGTRIRANSSESERVGLLSDAASLGARPLSTISTGGSGGGGSGSGRGNSVEVHRRGRSGSSVLSVDTINSGHGHNSHSDQVQTTRSRATSSAGGQPTPETGTSPEPADEGEDADAHLPDHSPPSYDEVSLNSAMTPVHTPRSTSPYPEPPPEYEEARRGSAAAAAVAAAAGGSESASLYTVSTANNDGHDNTDSVGATLTTSPSHASTARLPSLQTQLPQIVIEPSSALPQEDEPAHTR